MTPNDRNANKTVPTGNDVAAFVESIADETRRAEARLLVEMMTDVTGQPAVMWGPSIIGFGTQHLTYASGRELDYFRVGFAPRKAQSVLYVGGVSTATGTCCPASAGTRREGAACT